MRRQIGARLKALRIACGLTQERAAERMGLHPKYLQRLEAGIANPALTTLIAAAAAFEQSLAGLFGHDEGGDGAPFHHVDPADLVPYENAVPLYPLVVAAGALASGDVAADAPPDAWVYPHGHRTPRPGFFVAQVRGRSMNKRVPDGAFCLFSTTVSAERQGRILLVRHRDVHDPDLAGEFSLKIWDERSLARRGRRVRGSLRLLPDSFDDDQKPIVFDAAELERVSVVAELLEVLPRHSGSKSD